MPFPLVSKIVILSEFFLGAMVSHCQHRKSACKAGVDMTPYLSKVSVAITQYVNLHGCVLLKGTSVYTEITNST